MPRGQRVIQQLKQPMVLPKADAEGDRQRLQAETDAEDRRATLGEPRDQLDRYAAVGGRTRAGSCA